MSVHVHVSYYYDTGQANDVESGLGYWVKICPILLTWAHHFGMVYVDDT